jgi:type III secretory pathway component EscS
MAVVLRNTAVAAAETAGLLLAVTQIPTALTETPANLAVAVVLVAVRAAIRLLLLLEMARLVRIHREAHTLEMAASLSLLGHRGFYGLV